MSQTDPFRPAHNPGEYPEDPYAGEAGAPSTFGAPESVPPAVPPTGAPQSMPPAGAPQSMPPTGAPQSMPPADAPYAPPAPPLPPTGTAGSASGSTTDVAKDQAGDIKDATKEAGQQVVQETRQQVSEVAAEAKNQTGNLLRQSVAEINSQATQQQQRLAQSVHSVAKELGSMASSSDESGPATGLAHDASRRAGEVAHWLENHEPSDILDGLRSFARRRPGTFLVGAAAAGVLVGRLTRGLAAEAKSGGRSDTGNQAMPSHQAVPSPYSTGTDPIAAGDQPFGGPPPAGPEFSQAPSTPVGETGFDDTLPRGLGEAGPR